MAWLTRFVNIFRQEKLRREIEEELRYHIEARISDNLAHGMPADKARNDAFRRFGGKTLTLDKSRDADILVWVGSLLQDLRYGLRSLVASPGVTVIALFSLALSIASVTAIFSVVHAVLLRALPYKNPERLAILWVTNTLNGVQDMNASLPNFEDWKARSHSFENLASFRESDAALNTHGEPGWVEFAWVYGDFFQVLEQTPELGRVFSPTSKDAHEVVLSDRFWRTRFGANASAIGQTINVSGIDFQIAGVMPPDFKFPSKQTQLWAPAAALPDWPFRRSVRQEGFGTVIGRLRPGVTMAQARAEMQVINRQLVAQYPDANRDHGINILELATQIVGNTVPFMLAVLFSAVVFVLLIACANVANLLLARGAAREREIALRVALGAGRARIIRQLLTESVLLSSFAGVLALPLAAYAIRALIALAPATVSRLDEARLDLPVLAFSIILSLATGLLFGLAPAIRNSRDMSNRHQTAGLSSRGMRHALVIAEIALAVILLTGAGLLIRSFAAVESVNPGFQTERVLTATLRFSNTLSRQRRATFYHDAISRIENLPGVSAAGAVSTMFYTGEQPNFGLRAVEGQTEARNQWTPMTWSTVSGDYFRAIDVPLLRGRLFDEHDTLNAPPVVIINQTMARRYWPGENPIGKGIKGFDRRGKNDDWVRVVGVVRDIHSRGLEHAPMAQIFEPQAQSLDETEDLVVRTSMNATGLQNAIRSVSKDAILSDVATLNTILREQNAPRIFQMLLLTLFATMALTLAAAGIFGTMHFAVTRRTREIGIRMAVGARPGDVLGMVMRETLLLATIGTLAGLSGSLAITGFIRSLLFEVGPHDPVTLAVVSILLGSTALLAAYLPARRATRIDPILALRCE